MKIVKRWLLDSCLHVYSFVGLREVRKKSPSIGMPGSSQEPQGLSTLFRNLSPGHLQEGRESEVPCSALWPHPLALQTQ